MEPKSVLVESLELSDKALAGYLQRIEFPADITALPPATLSTLTALHRQHVAHIPFENLSVFQGCVDLSLPAIADKVCAPASRRGGYCFEQNKLFLAVLQRFGFLAELKEARVWMDDGETLRKAYYPPRNHVLIIARCTDVEEDTQDDGDADADADDGGRDGDVIADGGADTADGSVGSGGKSKSKNKNKSKGKEKSKKSTPTKDKADKVSGESSPASSKKKKKKSTKHVPAPDDTLYLCDVGFGRMSPHVPIPLQEDLEVDHGSSQTMLTRSECSTALYTQERWELWHLSGTHADWQRCYSFDACAEYDVMDMVPVNMYVYAHPESVFAQLLWFESMVEGVHTLLFGTELRITDYSKGEHPERRVLCINSACELSEMLKQHFGVGLAAPLAAGIMEIMLEKDVYVKHQKLLQLRQSMALQPTWTSSLKKILPF